MRNRFGIRRTGIIVGAAITVVAVAGCGSASTSAGGSSNTSAGSSQTGSTSDSSNGGGVGTSATGSNIQLQIYLSGTVKGQSLQGSVQPSRLMCIPTTNGDKSGAQVNWSGSVGSQQVAGEMQLPEAGTQSYGTTGAQGTLSLVVAGDYGNRMGAASDLGSGTATLNADLRSGMIAATVTDGGANQVHIQGTWTCT